MRITARTQATLTAVLALTVLPAGAAAAQTGECIVVDGPGSAVGDVECPAGEVDSEVDEGEQTGVLPGRIDRPAGAPAGDEDDETAGAPAVESAETELAASGAPADVAAVAALAALTLGGGALAATRRRQRTDS